ncbi:MAG: teichoic acid ABC transporter ATP-binding protein [Chloroflexi bacterium HGW-Chloroflexi-10]|jgi:ABC-2 type transport system ATP-binding protein/lipopolysaccharide transport system ATP-binding protein|nr:MAG: teichoic acid ABC transporter ATP-binding protein [Chloroflexi bacterium HGW-Chloroflexi-10]
MTYKILLDKVSVEYRIPSERIGTLKEYVIRLAQGRVSHRKFFALNNISLKIESGEVFGLIGHNGAGKSTMLKLIARVLTPTHGRIEVLGKVSPLLELGAGFHPELSGRENVFLNGALLGYSHKEMNEKLGSIIEFSGIPDFIDAPMRTYSSGMWARLGFAVATVTRPDVLLVDEVLAVGDEAFQQKCFERIDRFQNEGTTIILVTHSMETIMAMCHQVAWIDHGNLKFVGNPHKAVEYYRGLA